MSYKSRRYYQDRCIEEQLLQTLYTEGRVLSYSMKFKHGAGVYVVVIRGGYKLYTKVVNGKLEFVNEV